MNILFLFILGILLNQKFMAVNYEGAKNLIDTIFSEMDNDVLIDGNMKLIYFVEESVRITKGQYQTGTRFISSLVLLLQLFNAKIYNDVIYSILLLETHAIIAVTDCDEVHKAEKKAAERGVLFMGVTGNNIYVFL